MSYRISRQAVENSADALAEIERNARQGNATFFDIPPGVSPQTFIHDFHSLLASARFYPDLGFGGLRDLCSVALDYDTGRLVVYPSSMGKWNKPGKSTDRSVGKGQISTGGTLRSVHDVYADFIHSDKREARLKFKLPDDWDTPVEGMDGMTGEDVFRSACDSDNISIGEMTYHEAEDGTSYATCYAAKQSTTERRRAETGSIFDVIDTD